MAQLPSLDARWTRVEIDLHEQTGDYYVIFVEPSGVEHLADTQQMIDDIVAPPDLRFGGRGRELSTDPITSLAQLRSYTKRKVDWEHPSAPAVCARLALQREIILAGGRFEAIDQALRSVAIG